MRQADYLARLRADWTLARDRPRPLVANLRPEQRRWRPAEDAWSIDEVLEHLCATQSPYLRVIAERVAAGGLAATPAEPWGPRLGGRFLVWSFGLKRRFPTLAAFAHPDVRPAVLEEFERQLAEVGSLLDRAAALAWRRIRFRSPLASFVTLNLGDAFGVVIYHALRHYQQIERIRAAPGFPA